MAASTDNQAAIALLRRLRAGADDVHFVHRIDVCTAPPEVLVADLEPVPGTGLDDDGYSKKWYFYHAKRYKNSRGDTSGHRQRAVAGGGGASWHQESRKVVEGSGGGTFCSLSYGIKPEPSAPLDRFGWCMIEYDFVAADKQQDAADSSNYVLCKIYRSPRAKGKPASASASASSSSKTASSKQRAKKRKAGGDEHPEAPPAKLIQQQEPQVQQDTTACYQPQGLESEHGGDFNFNIEDINFVVDEGMLRDEPVPEPEPGLQQPTTAEPEHDGRFIQLPCGPVLAAEACTVGDMLLRPKTAVQSGAESEHGDMEEFTVEWFLRGEPQQPIVQPPGHGGEFIQMPCGLVVPAVAESTVDDMLGYGPETVYGMTAAASIPWMSSYYAPTTLYTGCSSLLQGPADPLRLPYLSC